MTTSTTADFGIAVGDTLPKFTATLRGADGQAINGSAATVRFRMRTFGASSWFIDRPAVWVDQAGGVAEYAWQTGDTAAPDTYEAHFVVTFSDGSVLSFPNEGFKIVEVFAEGVDAFWPNVDDFSILTDTHLDEGGRLSVERLLRNVVGKFVGKAAHGIQFVANDTRKLTGNWTSDLWLPEPPVTDVASVFVDVPGGIDIALAADHWDWRQDGLVRRIIGIPPTGVLRFPVIFGHWAGPASEITVQYSHGFATIPADVEDVILSAAERRWANPTSIEAEDIGNYHSVYARTTDPRTLFTDEELEVAKKYRDMTGPH